VDKRYNLVDKRNNIVDKRCDLVDNCYIIVCFVAVLYSINPALLDAMYACLDAG
jgi:hypothetical protein